jgi:NAD-dependent DNA ligase
VYEVWRSKELPHIPYPILAAVAPPIVATATPTKKEVYCMTGFRSAELEDALVKQGHEVSPTLTKKVSILIVASAMMMKEPNEKMKKAMENGVRILTREEVLASSK